jgi:hypothetical protein
MERVLRQPLDLCLSLAQMSVGLDHRRGSDGMMFWPVARNRLDLSHGKANPNKGWGGGCVIIDVPSLIRSSPTLSLMSDGP